MRHLLAAAAVLALAACTTYAPKPLPERVDMPSSAASVAVDPAGLPFRPLSSHLFDPSDGLDVDEVAMLAVANNPQLKQARDDLKVAHAQSFAAGLLPDPQLSLSFDHPTNGAAGTTDALGLNPSYDVGALLLRSSRVDTATAAERQVNLNLLWQEWQVVSQARLLFTRLAAQDALMSRIVSVRDLLERRYLTGRQALAEGNVTIDTVGADLAALQNVQRLFNETERGRLQNRAALSALLGLAADAPLTLVGDPRAAEIDPAGVRAELAPRLTRRPDLQALRAGYRSQEAKFRGAVLAQFPALSVGMTRARDTGGLYTLGFGLNLSLPLFNRNRGNIAVEEATRQKLFDEYRARLNGAHSEIVIALENLSLLQDQLRRTREGLVEVERVTRRAEAAYLAGNLPAADYLRLQTALLDKHAESINLQEATMEQQIAIETLMGPDLPEQENRSDR